MSLEERHLRTLISSCPLSYRLSFSAFLDLYPLAKRVREKRRGREGEEEKDEGWKAKSEKERERKRETGRQIANKQRCVPKFNLGYYIRLKIYSLCHIIDFWTAKAKVEFWNTPQTDIWRNRQFLPCMDFRRESFFHVFNTFARLK